MSTKKTSAEGKIKSKKLTEPKTTRPKKKAFKKFTGMALRNEIGVTTADRINLLVSRTEDEKHSIA